MNDEVLFTQQWATVADLLHREIGRALRSAFGVTYLAFCLLASVRSHGGRMALSAFPRDALANANTVTVAAAKATKQGYLEKRRCANDRRALEVAETPRGARIVESGFEAIYARLCVTVWKNHARRDIDETMHEFASVASKLGIDSVEINHRCHPVLTPSYLMCVAGLLRQWESRTARFAGLTFSEYRCLALLEHRLRSTVSPIVTRLADAGYTVVEVGLDRRCRCVSLTGKGRVVAALVTSELENITAELFSDASPSVKARANELHMRMYASCIL